MIDRDEIVEQFNVSMLPKHMRHSVTEYLAVGLPLGGFLSAIFEVGSLTEVVGRADEMNKDALVSVWAPWLYNYCPAAAHGSREKVDAWQEKGGLLGFPPKVEPVFVP